MPQQFLAITSWDQKNDNTAATVVHVTDTEPLSTGLSRKAGMSLTDFFESRGITVAQAMRAFPHTILPVGWDPDHPERFTWKSNFVWSYITPLRECYQVLADLVGMPVRHFIGWSDEHADLPVDKGMEINPA